MNVEETINSYKDKYVLVRTYDAGVHVGTLIDYDARLGVATLKDSRCIWSWEGALSLYEVALEGITDGTLTMVAPEILVARVEEIIMCSDKSAKQFKEFKAWER